jgi:transcriptional regulator with XRE-family HTH domain
MMAGEEKFGAFIRREREAKNFGLREMAKKVGVSPTYMSKIERDEFKPPAEDKVLKIAEILDINPDELLALAGKVSVHLSNIIQENPKEMAILLGVTSGMTEGEVALLTIEAGKIKDKGKGNA